MNREMKNSGIPWVGEIPDNWDINYIGNIYSLRNEKVNDTDYEPLSVTKFGIVPQLDTAAKTNDRDNRKLVKTGDFVINSRSDRRGACGISPVDGSVSLINIVLSPRGHINPAFYNWFFHTASFADEFYKWGHGIVDDLWTTRWQEMKRISIIAPPFYEQQEIADYLDKKCSVITEAVTKGLDSTVPMKDSGIPWIGEIPTDWEIKRIKNIFTLKTGTTPDGYDKAGDGEKINWFTPFDIHDEYSELYSSDRKLSRAEVQNLNLNPAGSLLFVGIGATAGKIGYLHVKSCNNQQITALIPRRHYSRYYFYYLIADKKRIKDNSYYTTLPIINNTYLAQIRVLCPSDENQKIIVDYLDKKCSEIDNLISIKQSKIDTLKEYKKSIIFEYVTGKREVNG